MEKFLLIIIFMAAGIQQPEGSHAMHSVGFDNYKHPNSAHHRRAVQCSLKARINKQQIKPSEQRYPSLDGSVLSTPKRIPAQALLSPPAI